MTFAPRTHDYRTRLSWTGDTSVGYRHYSRTHQAVASPAAEVALSADTHFRGDAQFMNPEQLLVMATSSCQLLSFLAVAAQRGVRVLGYTDDASGEMPEAAEAMRLTRIVLAPVITVAANTDPALVIQLVEEAHQGCYIANSLTADVIVTATVVTA